MTAATSPVANSVYGVERVCAAFGVPRSSFYAWRGKEALEVPPKPAGKRGPEPKLTDAELLVAIREDLASSPFVGEGHRKVWARLRVLREIRVARKRVLRVMRENHLLSPHRVRQGAAKKHDGHIMTDAPNVMWGTDGTRVFTVDDGWVSGLRGRRALERRMPGLARLQGRRPFQRAPACRHGRQGCLRGRLPRHRSRRRVAHGPRHAVPVRPLPQPDPLLGPRRVLRLHRGAPDQRRAERFNRTLQEQVIHGHVFTNIEEVRAAVRAFVEVYNEHWRVEKLGFRSPAQMRREWSQEAA